MWRFSILSREKIDSFSLVQFGLFTLQHRGEESLRFFLAPIWGIHTYKSIESGGVSWTGCHRTYALFYSWWTEQTKHPTIFFKDADDQGILSLVHNGHLINDQELRETLEVEDITFISDGSDSEIILRLIQKYFSLGL
ncbi:MAG: hypothetical protein ACMUEM_07690 [Flavobacteriales bacterium AspAUS03]